MGLQHAARPERGEPPSGARRLVGVRRRAATPAPRRRSRSSTRATSSGLPPSSEARVASSTLRKPWCSKPVSSSRCRTAWCRPAVHLNGSSRSSAASMHVASSAEVGNRSAASTAGAELQRDLAAASSSRAASQPCGGDPCSIGRLGEDGDLVEHLVEGVDDLDEPAGVVRQVVLVAQGELDGPQVDALRPGHPGDRGLDRPGAAGDHEVHREWPSSLVLSTVARCSTTSLARSATFTSLTTKPPTRAAYSLDGGRTWSATAWSRRCAAGREDRGVVDEGPEEVREDGREGRRSCLGASQLPR